MRRCTEAIRTPPGLVPCGARPLLKREGQGATIVATGDAALAPLSYEERGWG